MRPATQTLLLFALMTSIAFMRDVYAFSFPFLYAEDGIWAGKILTNGLWHEAFGGRSDFPVLGLLLMQGLSIGIMHAVFMSDISMLPQVIAIVASLFLGFVASLPWICLRDRLHPFFCLAACFSIALLPVGNSGFEIFGRILNLGFYMPVIAQFLLLLLLYRPLGRLATVGLHLAVLVLMWTFPVVIGQYILFVAFYVFVRRDTWRSLRLPLVGFACVLALALLAIDFNAAGKGGGVPTPFVMSGVPEFAIARSILFPIVAAGYSQLSDVLVFAILAAVIGLVLIYAAPLWKRVDGVRPSAALFDCRVFLWANFGLYLLATLVMRNGLTTRLDNNYVSSLPDRYFTGLNILFLMAMIVLLASHPLAIYRRLAGVGIMAMIVSWVVAVPLFHRTPLGLNARSIGTLKDTICVHRDANRRPLPDSSPEPVVVQIYPVRNYATWTISMPRYIFNQTVRSQCGRR